jgi:hypothetical protein
MKHLNTKPHKHNAKTLYEPWFRAWLILAPIVGLGSYYLMRNSWRRIRAILHGEAGSVWDAPPVPTVAEPFQFVLYAFGATALFSLFWFGITRLYVKSQLSSSE